MSKRTPTKPVVVMIASQKGGVGKSTLCANLAIAAEQDGLGPVALYDTDPQQSLAWWYFERQDHDTPLLIEGQISKLDETIEKAAQAGVRLVIIDTPPSVTNANDDLVRRSDFVLIPTQDGRPDIRAASQTVERVQQIGKPFAFVLTFVKGQRQAAAAAKFLSHHGPIAAMIGHRMVFKTAWNTASAAIETEPRGLAANEVRELWQYLGKQTGLLAPKKKATLNV